MAQIDVPLVRAGFGQTSRADNWWVTPLAVFLGLSNQQKTSGTSVRTKERITKAGSPEVRAALYFPAMTAIEKNPQLREFADRLKAKGKLYPVVRTAVTRKLVMLAWTLIKKGVDYDPSHVGGPN